MADRKAIGAGTTIEVSDMAVTPVFAAISDVVRIDPIVQTKPLVDATSLSSTAREQVPGLSDGQEFNVECFLRMDATTRATLMAFFAGGVAKDMRIHPNGQSKRKTFSAICTQSSEGPFEIDTVMRHSFRFKISGPVAEEAAP